MNPKFCSKKQLASCPYKNTYFCQKHLCICTYSEQKMESEKNSWSEKNSCTESLIFAYLYWIYTDLCPAVRVHCKPGVYAFKLKRN